MKSQLRSTAFVRDLKICLRKPQPLLAQQLLLSHQMDTNVLVKLPSKHLCSRLWVVMSASVREACFPGQQFLEGRIAGQSAENK